MVHLLVLLKTFHTSEHCKNHGIYKTDRAELVSSADNGGGSIGQKLCHLGNKDGTKLTVFKE